MLQKHPRALTEENEEVFMIAVGGNINISTRGLNECYEISRTSIRQIEKERKGQSTNPETSLDFCRGRLKKS